MEPYNLDEVEEKKSLHALNAQSYAVQMIIAKVTSVVLLN